MKTPLNDRKYLKLDIKPMRVITHYEDLDQMKAHQGFTRNNWFPLSAGKPSLNGHTIHVYASHDNNIYALMIVKGSKCVQTTYAKLY